MTELARHRILLVDGDASFAGALGTFLAGEGFLVDLAGDGDAGAALSGHYDAVILDVALPGVSGLDVLRRIRATSSVPVLILTASSGDVDRAVGLELGADDYIAKPPFPRELVARLRAVLRRSAIDLSSGADAGESGPAWLRRVRPLIERLRPASWRRLGGVTAALVLELLFLLLILGLTPHFVLHPDAKRITVFTLRPETASPETAAKPAPATKRPDTRTLQPPPPSPPPPPVVTPQAKPVVQPPPETPPAPPNETPAPPTPAPHAYGPPGPAAGSASGDTPVVGTAPNGEPLYAAAWYREPDDDELRGYLSTADGPGWALIACRTVRDYRVEDCVGLAEHPEGSHMLRSVLAAAWQFKVRPPRRGDKLLWGSWVQIRIEYLNGPKRTEPWRR